MIQTKTSIQRWVVELMAIRCLQLLEESVLEVLLDYDNEMLSSQHSKSAETE